MSPRRKKMKENFDIEKIPLPEDIKEMIEQEKEVDADKAAWYQWGKKFALQILMARESGRITEETRKALYDAFLGERFCGTIGSGAGMESTAAINILW
jgi:hypothetical protein